MNELLNDILSEYLKAGGCVSMTINDYVSTSSLGNGEIHYDLNVRLKSGIHLTLHNGSLLALQRYNEQDAIESMSDLIDVYKYWLDDAQTRGWGVVEPEPHWEHLMVKYGYLNVEEVVETKKVYNYK